MKDQIIKAFHPRDQKHIHSIPLVTQIDDIPLAWVDPSSRYGYIVTNSIDPIDSQLKLIGIYFYRSLVQNIGPVKMCDCCKVNQYSKDIAFWSCDSRVNKSKTHGFYICSDLDCLNLISGKSKKELPPSFIVENLTHQEKLERYVENVLNIIEIIST